MFECSIESPWIAHAIQIVLLVGGLLSVLVMRKAEHDQQINRVDSKFLRQARSWSFAAVAMSAFMTVATGVSHIMLLLLFASAAALLLVDYIALDKRPPHRGTKYSSAFTARASSILRNLLFRRKPLDSDS